MPTSRHRLDRGGVDLVGGFGSGGADLDPVAGEVGEEAGGHLGTAGVVDADEQDARFLDVTDGFTSLFRRGRTAAHG